MEKLSFITVEANLWPIVKVKFNRDLSKDSAQAANDLTEWIEHFAKLIAMANYKKSRFTCIYDHTHFQYPSMMFQVQTMKSMKANYDALKLNQTQSIMVMPAKITQIGFSAFTAVLKFPSPVMICSTIEEAMDAAKKATSTVLE